MGTRPRVLLVGGPDVDARLDLMRALAPSYDLAAAGTDPALAARFGAAGFAFHAYPMTRTTNPLADLLTFRALLRLLRAVRPDLVHAFDTKPTVWGRLAARIAGVPVIVGTLPGLGALYSTDQWRARAARLIYEPLQALACRLSSLTLFQNADDAREFERRGIVPRGEAPVIPGSGVRTDLFHNDLPREQRAALRATLGLPEDAVVVVMVSRVTRAKGVLVLVEAARRLREVAPGIRVVVAGAEDGAGADRLTPAELGELRATTTWLGRRSDIKEILAASDVAVLPSYYREGVPRALLEAAAMGLPLVAADVPGSRDVVRQSRTGFLVPPRDAAALVDALATLAGNPALRSRFGAEARRVAVAEYDLAHIAADTAARYADLLARAGRTVAGSA